MRNTKAKAEIEILLMSSERALSAIEVQKAKNGLCDRVTVYRILDRLLDEGRIHKIISLDGVVKYARCQTCVENHNHNHIHFQCQKCNSLTCLDRVHIHFLLPLGYTLSETNFTVSGLCPQCSC